MNTQRKHVNLIKSWADGAVIQRFDGNAGSWEDNDDPCWSVDAVYRIKPHKHQKMIDAHKNGVKIEYSHDAVIWRDIDDPCWDINVEYRIKPNDDIRYMIIGRATDVKDVYHTNGLTGISTCRSGFLDKNHQYKKIGELKLTIDQDTGKIKSVEIL